jgi:adenylate kinase
MLEERLAQPDARAGFILDGYPRNLAQCEALQRLLERLQQPVDVALQLVVPSEMIVDRLAGRAAAENRKDDTPDTVRERLRVYTEQTEPVAGHFAAIGQLVKVDGVGELAEVSRRILAALPRSGAPA